MHLLLTDGLTCPRCGPEFGLILLATRMEDRRVLNGTLGCSNCRDRYPVLNGFGDLRPEPREAARPAAELPAMVEPTEDEVVRVGALLGVVGGAGRVALIGQAARFASALAGRIADVDWVAISEIAAGWEESEGVDRIRVDGSLPFRDRTLRGVLMEGDSEGVGIAEAIRVLAPAHRLVLFEPPAGARDLLLSRGLKVNEPAAGVLVAAR